MLDVIGVEAPDARGVPPRRAMKAPAFEYAAPESVAGVVSLLAERADEAKILAGGQSLVPLMALRVAAPELLVGINGVAELDSVDRGPDRLRLGALVRHRAVEQMEDLRADCPLIADAVPLIGHVAIRNRGTVVGSLAHSDPAAEWPAIALALDAEITAVGPRGSRQISADAFFDSYLTTTLEDDELATHVELKIPRGRVGSAFVELARRHGDFAICGVAAVLSLTPAGAIDDARVGVAGAAPRALRIGDAERLLVGEVPSAAAFEAAADAVFDAVDPAGDIHGSAEYRRTVARVLTRRALERASRRATDEGDDRE